MKLTFRSQFPCRHNRRITFTSSAAVHGAFRNKTLADSSIENFSRVPDSFECLANVGGQPVWAVGQHGNYEHHCVGVDVPVFKQGEFFYSYFRELRWFSMVPLLHFLRGLLGPNGWPAPEPRASFIIDDPESPSSKLRVYRFRKIGESCRSSQLSRDDRHGPAGCLVF